MTNTFIYYHKLPANKTKTGAYLSKLCLITVYIGKENKRFQLSTVIKCSYSKRRENKTVQRREQNKIKISRERMFCHGYFYLTHEQ